MSRDRSRVPTRTFLVPGFFFWLHPRINGASTRYERLRKVPPLLEDFLSRCKSLCKSPEGRILGGSALQTAPTKPHRGKSTPGRYTARDRGLSLSGLDSHRKDSSLHRTLYFSPLTDDWFPLVHRVTLAF